MQRFLFFSFLILSILAWLHYSSPGRDAFTRTDFVEAPFLTDLSEIRTIDSLRNRPLWVKVQVSASMGSKMGGIALVEDAAGNQLWVVSRSLTPMADREVALLLIVREVFILQEEAYLLGAQVHVQQPG